MRSSLMRISLKRVTATLLPLLFSIYLPAQNGKFTITPNKLDIKSFISQLEEKSSYKFIYSDIEKELSKTVVFNPGTATVTQLLNQVQNQTGLLYNISGNTIALKAAPAKGSLSGYVTDNEGSRLEGATITIQKTTINITADQSGYFIVKGLQPGKYNISISYVGHETFNKNITITEANETILNAMLKLSNENNHVLNQVVVTGQYRPQSVNKSIYRVEVIDKAQIQNMAVSTVAELLKSQLNIEIENQSEMGRSKIRVLGLNSQYIKILMDNIPVAGDENMGSDVDLSTISLDDVERIEIVKGAMGVEYGANSIGGVVNIITKKTARNKTDLSFEIQEETVRDEYNVQYNSTARGRHIQRFNFSQRITSDISAGVSFSRDKFNGYRGERIGAGLILEPIDAYSPPKRGFEWSPKESYNGNFYLSRTGNNLSLFYKFNYFTSDLTHYGRTPVQHYLTDERIYINGGVNNDYHTERYNHHLNARGNFWKNAHFSLDVSMQKNGLEHRRQGINLMNNTALDAKDGIPGSDRLTATGWEKHFQSKGFYTKGSVIKPLIENKLEYNLGFEMDNTRGNQGYTSWFNDVSLSTPIEQVLFTGAAYTSAEWTVSDKIMIRPGFRVNFSNRLKMRTNESITTRYKLNNNNDIRFIIGTSTRFPNYEELYSWYVNSVHDYRGNPDLKPEYGKSVEIQWAHRKEINKKLQLETSLSSMYQHLTDRIVPIRFRVEGATQITGRNTYTNEQKYNGIINQLRINLVSDKFSITTAASLLAFRGHDPESISNYTDYLTNIQANFQMTYVLPKDIRISAFYRYVGREPIYEFQETGMDRDFQATGYVKVLYKTDDYHNLDLNLARSFFKNKIDFRIGVRNLFDVTDIFYTPINPPRENMINTQRVLRLYYGRSYFAKITFNLFR
ncbi:TonB-dependent receptor [Gynurincola endophyticus]|uniref:TonB-dependent receptor n=1 Tax=Gynurincola endophyticus TaxID=2479004 RepID=UPI000F8EB7BF|nr:TonB-dependent receptor [Gynurincola endophyticus]